MGLATFHSCLDPGIALLVYRDLSICDSNAVILSDDLQIVYQITPLPAYINPPWTDLMQIYDNFCNSRQKIINLLGITPAFLVQVMMRPPSFQQVQNASSRFKNGKKGVKKQNSSIWKQANKEKKEGKNSDHKVNISTLTYDDKLGIMQRLYCALIVCEILNETPNNVIAKKFGVERGPIQQLQSSVATFAGMVSIFCEKLNWWELRLLINEYCHRLRFGIKNNEKKYLPLLEISKIVPNYGKMMTKTVAKILFENGIKTIKDLSNSHPTQIAQFIMDSKPFEAKIDNENEHSSNSNIGIFGDERIGMKLVKIAKYAMTKKNDSLKLKRKKLEANMKLAGINVANLNQKNGMKSIMTSQTLMRLKRAKRKDKEASINIISGINTQNQMNTQQFIGLNAAGMTSRKRRYNSKKPNQHNSNTTTTQATPMTRAILEGINELAETSDNGRNSNKLPRITNIKSVALELRNDVIGKQSFEAKQRSFVDITPSQIFKQTATITATTTNGNTSTKATNETTEKQSQMMNNDNKDNNTNNSSNNNDNNSSNKQNRVEMVTILEESAELVIDKQEEKEQKRLRQTIS